MPIFNTYKDKIMWFKNLRIYRFTKEFEFPDQEFEEKLATAPFVPCGKIQPKSYGWTEPMGKHGKMLIHSSGGKLLFCAKQEEKLLPASVINELLDEKAAEIEEQTGSKPGRKQKEQMKEELIIDLLPRAFSRKQNHFGYIDRHNKLLILNSSSSNKAEELTEFLRKTLGSLTIIPIKVNNNSTILMTQWVSGEELPGDFELGQTCELKEPGDDGGVVRCSKQDLLSDEIQAHISAGKEVQKLALKWDNKIEFVLHDDLSIKRLKFSDELQEKVDESAGEDPATRFDADFSLMTLELANFIPRLIEIFGGDKNTD